MAPVHTLVHYPCLLNACPARHVNELLAADDVVGEAHDQGRGICYGRHLPGDGDVHQVLDAVHNLRATHPQQMLRLQC